MSALTTQGEVVAAVFELGASEGQGRSAWPGGYPDVVEYGRAVIAAFAYVSREQSREIHVMRLRSAFERAGLTHALRYALAVLTLMREVQELGSGYWFPTPTRLVPIAQTALVITPVPTAELQRHLAVLRAGHARYVSSYAKGVLPEQSLEDWLGIETGKSTDWTKEILRRAEDSLGPTIDVEGVELFSVRQLTRRGRVINACVWTGDGRKALTSKAGLVLGRKRVSQTYYRYFCGILKGARLREEAEAPADIPRLQYGMAALAGAPLSVEHANTESGSVFTILCRLPQAERRLFTALAHKTGGTWEKTYAIEVEEHGDVLERTLKNLGADIGDANGK